MLSRIRIENFRSIEVLDFKPKQLSALVGANSAGKTNILKALDILLGESWPSERAFTKDDFYKRDESRTIRIQVWFDKPLETCRLRPERGGSKVECRPVSLEFTHTKNAGEFYPGLRARDEDGNIFWASGEAKNQVNFVYVSAQRDFEKQMGKSQYSILGKILRRIDEDFRRKKLGEAQYNEREQKLREAMKVPKEILEDDFAATEEELDFKKFREIFQRHCKSNAQGLMHNLELELEIYDPLFYYKTIQLIGQEHGGSFNVEELGTGVQNLILLALFKTYGELMKNQVVLAIEEPELYLHPQAQRQLYKQFRAIASSEGPKSTQIFYATHSPNFVNLSKYSEVFLIFRDESTKVRGRSGELAEEEREELKLLTEFNPERNEMFFASRVLLVEGETEKHAMPYIFETLERPPEKENIATISASGKDKLRFLIKICKACSINWAAIHDTDSDTDEEISRHEALLRNRGSSMSEDDKAIHQRRLAALREKKQADEQLNQELADLGGEKVIPLDPNFSRVLGLASHKEEKWKEIKEARNFCMQASVEDIPGELKRVVEILFP